MSGESRPPLHSMLTQLLRQSHFRLGVEALNFKKHLETADGKRRSFYNACYAKMTSALSTYIIQWTKRLSTFSRKVVYYKRGLGGVN